MQAAGLRFSRWPLGAMLAAWCVHGKTTVSSLVASETQERKTVAVDARIAQDRVVGEAAGDEDTEEALFAAVREHAKAMIAWARSGQSLAWSTGELESKAMKDGMEFMRLLVAGTPGPARGPRAAPARCRGRGRRRAHDLRGRA